MISRICVFVFLLVAISLVSIKSSAECKIDAAANRYSITEKNDFYMEAYVAIHITYADTLVKRKSARSVNAFFDIWFVSHRTKQAFLEEARAAGFVLENESPVDLDGFKYYLLLQKTIEKDLICMAKAQALLKSIAIGKDAKVDLMQLAN